MKRNKFNLSFYKLLSCDMGELVPCGLVEVLPGDTFQHSINALVRAAPLLSPVMHPVDVRIHCWFVPHRLIWDDWENFVTGGPDGLNASVFPTITIGGGSGAAVGSLADYLGVPTGVNNIVVSALPFRAYAAIWNEWYRDQDLETKLTIDTTDGADTTTNTVLQNCDWEKDYFTSARPWAQKGATITVPLGTEAAVKTKVTDTVTGVQTVLRMREATTGNQPTAGGMGVDGTGEVEKTGAFAGGTQLYPSNLYADLSSASAVTVNTLRNALALQRFEEARARYGSRYVEYLRYLGVRSSDARLQRPEYLGGGRSRIQFSEVVQTAPAAGGSTPLAELAGHGISTARSYAYRRFFEEHGYMMCLMSVKPKTMYVQGLWRTWNRRVKEDFFQRELQTIGQQPILNKEVYAAHATPDGTFGYQDRYDDYRRMESSVGGEFRNTTLDFWHMARTFTSDPALNATFVKCVPTERTFAVPSEDVIYIMARHSLVARRLLNKEGVSLTF